MMVFRDVQWKTSFGGYAPGEFNLLVEAHFTDQWGRDIYVSAGDYDFSTEYRVKTYPLFAILDATKPFHLDSRIYDDTLAAYVNMMDTGYLAGCPHYNAIRFCEFALSVAYIRLFRKENFILDDATAAAFTAQFAGLDVDAGPVPRVEDYLGIDLADTGSVDYELYCEDRLNHHMPETPGGPVTMPKLMPLPSAEVAMM